MVLYLAEVQEKPDSYWTDMAGQITDAPKQIIMLVAYGNDPQALLGWLPDDLAEGPLDSPRAECLARVCSVQEGSWN